MSLLTQRARLCLVLLLCHSQLRAESIDETDLGQELGSKYFQLWDLA